MTQTPAAAPYLAFAAAVLSSLTVIVRFHEQALLPLRSAPPAGGDRGGIKRLEAEITELLAEVAQ